MSKKPTIKISYPEASDKALRLTEAMVKRAPGKRVVETESEDPVFPDGGELFSSFIRCKTQTGVELTLTLNSSSMDYALETLIRPNLTADERKEILGEPSSEDDLPLTRDKEKESKPETCLWMAAALGVLLSLTSNSPAGKKSTWRSMGYIYLNESEGTIPEGAIVSREDVDLAYEIAEEVAKEINPTSPYIVNPEELLERVLEEMRPEEEKNATNDPSWDDVEAEARQMYAPKTKQSEAPLADDGDATDRTEDAELALGNEDKNSSEEGENNG